MPTQLRFFFSLPADGNTGRRTVFLFPLVFLGGFPEINLSNLSHFSFCSMIDKLSKGSENFIISSADQKMIFQFHKRKEKVCSFRIFYYCSDVESK